MLLVKCLVACLSPEGLPTLFPVIVELKGGQYGEGVHVEVASWAAERAGMEETGLVYDELTNRDFPALFQVHDWSTATVCPLPRPKRVAALAGV